MDYTGSSREKMYIKSEICYNKNPLTFKKGRLFNCR